METADFATSHSIWQVLPLHPHPEVLESMTSYLIRLREANGLRSMNELVALAGLSRRRLESVSSFPDSPVPSYYPGLAQITRCSEERLQHTTFHPLIEHFGCSMHPLALHRFLAGSLASTLRYCPCCLAEDGGACYSLLWRFLRLPGCMKHGIELLDLCPHCRSPLPLFSLAPRLGLCLSCQGDLRRGPERNLSDVLLSLTHRRTQELKLLLSPTPVLLDQEQAKVIGKRYMALRQQKDLSIREVAHLLGKPTAVIMDIEQTNHTVRANLADYMHYVDALSCSLLEVFDMESWHSLLSPPSEDLLLKQVESAIQQLQRQGEPLLRRTIGNLIGMQASHLRAYPQVHSLLSARLKGHARRSAALKNQPEEEVVKLVEQAIEQLKARGSPVSLQRIADLLGTTRSALWVCPCVRARLEQIVERLTPLDLLTRVQDAIEQALLEGTALSYQGISERIGLSSKTLRRNLQARVLIERAQNEVRQLRENALVSRVEHVIKELLQRGEKVSCHKVCRIVGMGHNSLYEHPRLRELFFSLREG